MISHFLRLISCFLFISSACEAVCTKQKYDNMVVEYNQLFYRVNGAYKNGVILKSSYDYYLSTLQILKDYMDSYLQVLNTPPNAQSPDNDQCDSMEMQVDDVIAGFKRTLAVELPQQTVPEGPLAPSREARGPSPKQSVLPDIKISPSDPFVATPKSSVMTDTPLTPSMPKQNEPQASMPKY
jgi:hypothetical protein